MSATLRHCNNDNHRLWNAKIDRQPKRANMLIMVAIFLAKPLNSYTPNYTNFYRQTESVKIKIRQTKPFDFTGNSRMRD